MEGTLENVEIGSQVYLEEGDDRCGAVRNAARGGRNAIRVYSRIPVSSSSTWMPFVPRTMAK
jgi:hypothetical protein